MLIYKIYWSIVLACAINSSINAEIKRIQVVIPNLQCSYGAQGIAQKITQYTWFKSLSNKNLPKGLVELTLTHNNTVNLESIEQNLEAAAQKANYHYEGIKNLTAWGLIRHSKNGYFLQVSGSQDTIYLLEEDHKSSSFFKWAFNAIKEFFTGSQEKTHKRIEHLCAENCPVKLCATIHRHDDKTYGATKIIHLDAQE